MSTPVFVLTNHKGGVGKSTSATTLAHAFLVILEKGGVTNPRVLIIDTDSQGHSTVLTTRRKDFGEENSLYTVLTAPRQHAHQVLMDTCVTSHWHPGLSVLPSARLLDKTEQAIAAISGAPYLLQKALEPILAEFHAVFIDTRPSFSLLTIMGLVAASDALIPVEPRYLERQGMLSAIAQIREIREGWNRPDLNIRGLLITKMDKRVRGHQDALEAMQQHKQLGDLVYGIIPDTEVVSYAHAQQQSLLTYDPRSTASRAYAQIGLKLVQDFYGSGAK
jgi:chromosome partitioning protein